MLRVIIRQQEIRWHDIGFTFDNLAEAEEFARIAAAHAEDLNKVMIHMDPIVLYDKENDENEDR